LENAMVAWVGLDCSKYSASVCVVGLSGEICAEGDVASDPASIATFLRSCGQEIELVGIEASGSTSWLQSKLIRLGFPVVCIEARHAHSVLKNRTNKTDRNDARGLAEIMRLGAYRAVHSKDPTSRRLRLLLSMRRLLLRRQLDLEKGVRAALLEYGLKLPTGARKSLAKRVRILLVAKGHLFLEDITREVLVISSAMAAQVAELERQIELAAATDPICKRLMTAPGVGPLVAVTYRTAVDDPHRFLRSRDVAAYFGLTPRAFNSGKSRRNAGISRRGDVAVRSALFLAAQSVMRAGTRTSWLQRWGREVAQRRGSKKAHVAVARQLAVVMHRMWTDGSEFRWLRDETTNP
jgi:transposase